MARKTITVTPEDARRSAERGGVGVSRSCMHADAMNMSGHCVRAQVDSQTMRWTDPKTGDRLTALTPGVVQASLANFDKGFLPLEAIEYPLPRAYHRRPKRKTVKKVTVLRPPPSSEASPKVLVTSNNVPATGRPRMTGSALRNFKPDRVFGAKQLVLNQDDRWVSVR